MRRESIVPRIMTIIIGLFLCAYIGFQAYRALYEPVRTVSAVYTEVDDFVEVDGCIIRDESVLIKDYGEGVLEMSVEEGERVANGEAVAVVYTDEVSAENSHDVQELDEQIQRITTIYARSGESNDMESVNNKLTQCSIAIAAAQQQGVYEDLEEAVEDLKLQTLAREYMYRDKTELLSVIEELKTERKKISGKSSVKSRVYAPRTGYFSQNSDGYEKELNSKLVMSLTPSQFESVRAKTVEVAPNTVGKLISSNIWYYAAVMDKGDATSLNEGKVMTLRFQDKSLPEVQGEIVRITDPEADKVMVVFECNTHISDFTKARNTVAQIIIETHSGLKVPREALRVDVNGVRGVYCLIDSQVKFKPIEVVFEKDGYYISKYDSSDTTSLLLYDEIVVSAKNLENKKIVK